MLHDAVEVPEAAEGVRGEAAASNKGGSTMCGVGGLANRARYGMRENKAVSGPMRGARKEAAVRDGDAGCEEAQGNPT